MSIRSRPPFVYRFVSMPIEPSVFLRRVYDPTCVRRADGSSCASSAIVLKRPALDEPVIDTDTRLGAATHFGDDELVPARGQLVFVPPDDRVDYLTIGGGEGVLYMFPRSDGLLLCRTFERGPAPPHRRRGHDRTHRPRAGTDRT